MTNVVCTFEKFKEKYIEIGRRYLRYGDIVLQKDLTDDEEDFRKLFKSTKSICEIENSLFRYWKTKFTIVIDSFPELFKIYNENKDKGKFRFAHEQMISKGEYNIYISSKLYDVMKESSKITRAGFRKYEALKDTYCAQIYRTHGTFVMHKNTIYEIELVNEKEYLEIVGTLSSWIEA